MKRLLLLCLSCTFFTPWVMSQCVDYTGIDITYIEDEVCYSQWQIQFVLTTTGGFANDNYNIDVYESDGTNPGSGTWYNGNGSAYISKEIQGCEPELVDITLDIICEDGTIIESIEFTVPFYPELRLYVDPPSCESGQDGFATLNNRWTNEVCQSVIGTSGIVGICEESSPALLEYSFDIHNGSICSYNLSQEIEMPCNTDRNGCLDPDACNYNQVAECDDGSCQYGDCCPRPIDFPTAVCDGQNEICVEFEAPTPNNQYSIFSEFGNLYGFQISQDGSTVCFELFIHGNSCNLISDIIGIESYCNQDYTVSYHPIDIYPNPEYYFPRINFSSSCLAPTIEPGTCGQISNVEVFDGDLNCDDPSFSTIQWTIDPPLDLSNAPDCYSEVLQGSISYETCKPECPCEGVICEGACVDITINLLSPTSLITCANSTVEVELEYQGIGANYGNYYIEYYISGLLLGNSFHSPGDPVVNYNNFYIPDFNNCEPIDHELTFTIYCGYANYNTVISTGTLGTITIYPSIHSFTPLIIYASCGMPQIINGNCGSFSLDPSEISSSCGPDIQYYTWTVEDYGFDLPDLACYSDPNTGTITQYPCEGNPGETCFKECMGSGIVSDDCLCIYDNPIIVEYNGPSDIQVCEGSSISIDLDIVNDNGSDLTILLTDSGGAIYESERYFSGSGTPFQIDFYINNNNACFPYETEIYLEVRCQETYETLYFLPITTLTIYPNLHYVEVLEIYSTSCGEVPELVTNGCGTPIITNIVPPIEDPDNPMDGYVEYTVDVGFDISNAPAGCINEDILTGMIPIYACTDFVSRCDFGNIELQPINEIVCSSCVYFELSITDSEGQIATDDFTFVVTGSDGSSGYINNYDGYGYGEICILRPDSCEPSPVDLTISAYCYDGTLLETLTHTVTFYPNVFVDIHPPECDGINGGSATVVTSSSLGSYTCTDTITGTPGILGCSNAEPAILNYSFLVYEGTPCETLLEDEYQNTCLTGYGGCTDPNACNYQDYAECDDGSCFVGTCCPNPISISESALCSPRSAFCVQFEDGYLEYINLDVYAQSGNLFIYNESQNGSEFCFETIIYHDGCSPLEDVLIIEYYCNQQDEYITREFPITIYPDPELFIPIIDVRDACDPIIQNECGIYTLIETTPATVDCDNPVPATITWEINPRWDISDAPDCFITTGTAELPLCLESCPCEDGFFCNGLCTDISIQVNYIDENVCTYGALRLEYELIGLGAVNGYYSIEIFVGNRLSRSYTHNPGDNTQNGYSIYPGDIMSCTPIEEEITYIITCIPTEEVISAGTIGNITIYPYYNLYTPIIIPGSCGVPAQVISGPCGELTFDEGSVYAECGTDANATSFPWSVEYDFPIDSTLPCNYEELSGTVTQSPCEGSPGEPCFDECNGRGTVSDNCECIFDNPIEVSYTGPSEYKVCSYESISIILDIQSNDRLYFDFYVDQNLFFGNTYLANGPSPHIVDLPRFENDEHCMPIVSNLYARVYCYSNANLIQVLPIATITIYPYLGDSQPAFLKTSVCGDVPQPYRNGCGIPVITYIEPPINDPANPTHGYAEYNMDYGFDLSQAPDGCYEDIILNGNIRLPHCVAESDIQENCDADNGTLSIRKHE